MRSRRRLLWILGLAVGIRVAFVLGYPQVPVVNDAAGYDATASHLALKTPLPEGEDGAGQIRRGPIYVAFLAAIYRCVGHHHAAVRIVQAMLSASAVLLIYALGRAVFNAKVGLIASLLAALYPPFISYPGWLLTETLSVFLLLAFVYSLVRAWQRSRTILWMGAGLLGGITVLHRAEMLLIVGCAVLLALWWRAGLTHVGMLALVAALTVVPWMVRNALRFGEFAISVAPGSGNVLWISTVETEGPEWDANAAHLQEYRALVAGATPHEADRRLRRDAIRRILTQPLKYLKLCVKRVPAFWVGGHSNTFLHLGGSIGSYVVQREYGKVAVKLAMFVYNMGIVALGLWGMHLVWKLGMVDPRPVALMVMPVVVTAFTHCALFAALRYQVPIMAFVIVFAAFTLWHARRALTEP